MNGDRNPTLHGVNESKSPRAVDRWNRRVVKLHGGATRWQTRIVIGCACVKSSLACIDVWANSARSRSRVHRGRPVESHRSAHRRAREDVRTRKRKDWEEGHEPIRQGWVAIPGRSRREILEGWQVRHARGRGRARVHGGRHGA